MNNEVGYMTGRNTIWHYLEGFIPLTLGTEDDESIEEEVWCMPEGSLYRIAEIPKLAEEFFIDDLVRAEEVDDGLINPVLVKRERSSHCLFFVPDDGYAEKLRAFIQSCREMGVKLSVDFAGVVVLGIALGEEDEVLPWIMEEAEDIGLDASLLENI